MHIIANILSAFQLVKYRAARFALEFAGDNNIRDNIKSVFSKLRSHLLTSNRHTQQIEDRQWEPECIKLDKSAKKKTKNAAANQETFLVKKSALEQFLNVRNAHKFCQGNPAKVIRDIDHQM